MKFTALILAVFVSFLALKPGVDLVCSILINQEVICCITTCTPFSDKDINKNQEQDNDCGGKLCNPFQTCSSCVLLVNSITSIDILLGDFCEVLSEMIP